MLVNAARSARSKRSSVGGRPGLEDLPGLSEELRPSGGENEEEDDDEEEEASNTSAFRRFQER